MTPDLITCTKDLEGIKYSNVKTSSTLCWWKNLSRYRRCCESEDFLNFVFSVGTIFTTVAFQLPHPHPTPQIIVTWP